jgi:hypothetical protein
MCPTGLFPCCHHRAAEACCDDGEVTEREDPETAQPDQPPPAKPARGQTRKPSTVADVFGDVLPDLTSDERAHDPASPTADTWYEDNRPPHHDPR